MRSADTVRVVVLSFYHQCAATIAKDIYPAIGAIWRFRVKRLIPSFTRRTRTCCKQPDLRCFHLVRHGSVIFGGFGANPIVGHIRRQTVPANGH